MKNQAAKAPGPFASSSRDDIQFEFVDGGCNEVNFFQRNFIWFSLNFLFKFFRLIQDELMKKRWLVQLNPMPSSHHSLQRTGISGIEKQIQHTLNVQQQSISGAFQDLDQLMKQVRLDSIEFFDVHFRVESLG